MKQPSNREFPYETTDQSYIHSHVFSPHSQHKAATPRRSLQDLLLQKADANEAPWLCMYITNLDVTHQRERISRAKIKV